MEYCIALLFVINIESIEIIKYINRFEPGTLFIGEKVDSEEMKTTSFKQNEAKCSIIAD